MSWEPITKSNLGALIEKQELRLSDEQKVFWRSIEIPFEKWSEEKCGKQGGGFWVVGIFGEWALWYNDIEEGFNISKYTEYGKINEYSCEQDELWWSLNKIDRNGLGKNITLTDSGGK